MTPTERAFLGRVCRVHGLWFEALDFDDIAVADNLVRLGLLKVREQVSGDTYRITKAGKAALAPALEGKP